ncbi:MAG: hypothetical protein J7598_25260 [Mitsuaria chitosanitabida]|uniref:hypothetical protein n=1 Tax=Roseateles chitosanitabidus TaxID=65048 RepID=UPI001B09F4BA|nr:hypothetical protein [Roseateles chitosanitabidus]MBO9689923.1 hypothetical protein [Roseateles chitosanitabidus]
MLQHELDEVRWLKVFKQMRSNLVRPAFTAEQFVESLAKAGLVRTAAKLAEAMELI